MKKSKLILFALPLLLLASCSSNDIPNISHGDDFDDGGMFDDDKATIRYYISAAFADEKLVYATEEVTLGGKLTKPEGIPTNPDGAFTEFIGWSHQPIITDNSQLWDFENNTIPDRIPGLVFRMYGIWA